MTDTPLPPDDRIDPELYGRFLTEELAAGDQIRVAQWGNTAQRQRLLAAHQDTALPDPEQTERAWLKLQQRVGDDRRRPVTLPANIRARQTSLRKTSRSPRVFSVGILGVLTVLIGMYSGNARRSRMLAHTYTTAAGQRAMVTFHDGSRIVLGPSTMLSIAPHASETLGAMAVVGEALITVAHRSRRSLSVSTHNTTIRVLGTTFLVRHYVTDPQTLVVVTEGRISLGRKERTLSTDATIITANTMALVDDSGHVRMTPHIESDPYIGWVTGQLVFRKTPVRQAATELGRAYDVEIRVPDSTLATQTLNWTVPLARQSFTDVLESLVDVLDAHAIRTGRVITLVPGRAASNRPVTPQYPSALEHQYGR